MTNRSAPPNSLGNVLKALSDPTRRVVLERLSLGPAAATALAEPFDMALPSFLQHMDMLEKSGLVRSEKRGRVRTYHLSPEPLRQTERWLAAQRAIWERRLDQFDRYVTTLHASRAADAPNGGASVYVPGPSPFTPSFTSPSTPSRRPPDDDHR